MKLFVALAPDGQTTRELLRTTHEFAAAHPKARLENGCDLHLTLCYLGDSTPLEEVCARLAGVEIEPFELDTSGLGVFENTDETVVWTGVKGNLDCLARLKALVDQALYREASRPEFIPHITLAYTNPSQPIDLTGIKSPKPCRFSVNCFSLYRVESQHVHYRFQPLANFPLEGKKTARKVHLLCVNDFHAAILENSGGVGAAKLTGAVRDFYRENPDTAVVFGGDNYFGDPISQLYDGEPVTRMMRQMHTKASVIGNHDFDFGSDLLRRWQTEGEYPFLGANVMDCQGNHPDYLKPYTIVELGGIRVALLGLATTEDPIPADRPPEMRELVLEDGTAWARFWLDYLKQGKDPTGRPDAVIALTHFGLRRSRQGELIGPEIHSLCQALPELDGAFTAHWHQFLCDRINGVPVAQGGSTGRGFALLTLYLDHQGKLIRVLPDYVDLMPQRDALHKDPAADRMIQEYMEQARAQMDQVVAVAEKEIVHRDPLTNVISSAGTPLTLLAARVAQKATGCCVALLYAGRMGTGFAQGPVTLYQYYRTMMFACGLVTLELSGSDLLVNLETGLRTLK